MEPAGADQRTAEMEECGQEVGAALVADRQAPIGQQPGQGALHLPALAAQPLAGLHPTAGDPRRDVPAAQHPPAARGVIALVAMELGWSPPRPTGPSPRADDCRDGVHHGLQQLRVMGVGRRQPDRQGQAGGVNQQVVLGAWLAPVDRVCANQFPHAGPGR